MTRTDIINALIKKFAYWNYLEIGVQTGVNLAGVDIKQKIGVDPDPSSAATTHCTSDEFFFNTNEKFDIVFIDGLHHAIQVYKDICNALDSTTENSTIVCHDMTPKSKEAQVVPRIQKHWQGDCWMAWVLLRATREDIEMFVVDTDSGCGVIRRGHQDLLEINENITYENFEKNKKEWLNLITVEEFKQWLSM